ncbi:MAG TPA: GNAT family N-acetyltransferase [Methylomirabilota bacterium]|nr:GNAT family N-acetyltransferase [Methylomirabilota bacterium]
MLRDLGDGLVLRRATPADAEPMAAFVGSVLRAQDGEAPSAIMSAWERDLMEGRHPSFRPEDATVVADGRTGAIVSCLHLLSQTWSYGGVPIAVGQPELIGTLPERRGGGLVRAQFEVVHGWSAARRHRLLAITGIPWFYRQFGYEMAIGRGGGPRVRLDALAPLPPAPAGWTVRPAAESDVPFLAELSAVAASRSLVTVPRDATLWRYELEAKRADSAARREIRILERGGERVGYLAHVIELWGGALAVTAFEVKPGVSWREAWIPALHHLFAAGDGLAGAGGRCTTLNFWLLGEEHPLYRVYRFKERDDGYAWYARVPDVAGFLGAVAPALERRLAASPCAGHTGTLTLGFYRGGVRLALARGKVTGVEPWRLDITVRGLEFGRASSDPRRPLAMFPDLTFLQLLFGFRALEELELAFPDCVVRTNEARALLGALFPKAPSDVWPVT